MITVDCLGPEFLDYVESVCNEFRQLYENIKNTTPFCIKTVADKFALFQKAVPWIALLLLCWIGGKMLWEGLKPGDGEEAEGSKALTFGLLAVQGIATSIDALSVGFNMVDMQYSAGMAALSAALIALLTFFICYAGLYIGKKFGTKLANKASVLGGVILVAIGFWIFFS